MAKKSRRFLALVLTLLLVFSLLPISGIADGENDANSGTVEHQGTEVTAESGKVKIQKTAARTGKNTFDITLSTTTADDVQTTTTSNPAHVVLVIDHSFSMKGTKLTNTILAAQNFVNAFFGDDSPADNKLAVVSFSGNASTDFVLSDKSKKSDINTKIGQLTADGGTNTQGGIHAARGILSAGHTAGVKDIIVLLSDGEPTYSYKLTGTATWVGRSRGHVDKDTIAVTGCDYSSRIGSGSGYNLSGNNLSLTFTSHDPRSVKYDDSGIVRTANNGYATIWEANQAKAAGDDIYSILLSGSDSGDHAAHVMQGVATDADHYKTTGDAAAIGGIFTTISDTITTPTAAGIVTDPMGTHITYVGLKNPADAAAATFDNNTRTLTWDSSQTTATTNANGSKTRTLTYTVKLNTADADFDESLTYPTNGTTTFNYSIGGTAKSVDFDVPTVSGIIPERGYTVAYYKWDKTKGDYPATPTKTVPGSAAAVGTSVSATAGYLNEYTSDNYAFDHGNPSITIGENAEDNVICLYYKPVTASVTVNYYYKTTTTDVNGNTSVTEDYASSTTQTSITAGLYVGDSYILTPSPKDGGYAIDDTQSNSALTIGSLSATPADNIINLYYARAIDNRNPAGVTVRRVYTHTQWDATNFTYKTPVSVIVDEPPVTGLKQYSPFTTGTAPGAAYSAYTFTGTDGSTSTASVNSEKGEAAMTLGAGDNVLQLNYSFKDPEPAKITVTVNHYYTKTTTTIGGSGNKTTVTDPDNELGNTETIQVYPGQSCTAYSSSYTSYEGDTYIADAASRTINAVSDSDKTIEFHYSLTDDSGLTPATLTVHYEYYLREMAIDGGVAKYEDDVLETSGTKTYPENGGELYVGQDVAVDPGTDAKYPYAYDGTNPGANIRVNSPSQEITFKYYRTEDLALVPVTVNYHYKLTTYTVDGGVLTPHVTGFDGTSVTVNKYVGETYAIPGAPTLEGKTYTPDASNPASITVAAAPEGEPDPNAVTLYYTLSEYPQETAAVQVIYKYYTVDYNGTETEDTGHASTIDASSFAGVDYTAPDGTTDGYAFSSGTATPDGFKDGTERTVVLAAGENTITLTYKKNIDSRKPTTVTLKHIYRLGTPQSFTEEGSYEETISNNAFVDFPFTVIEAMERLTNIVGGSTYTYTFGSADPGITIKPVANGNNVINLYYYRTTGYTPPYVPVDPTPTPTTPTTEIPEPTTPTTDVPEPTTSTTDINDPDTPKADASKQTTGDELSLWIALAGGSGLSLAWLVVADLKRRKGNSDK